MRNYVLGLVISMLSGLCVANAEIRSMDIFTDSKVSVRRSSIEQGVINIHNLDRLVSIKEELEKGLPKGRHNYDLAVSIMSERLKIKIEEGAFKNIYGPMIMARKYGIKYVPAILINNKYVIYGVSDIGLAIRIWSRASPGNINDQ